MTILQFIDALREKLTNEPDESTFMGGLTAANRRFISDDGHDLTYVNYVYDHDDKSETFTIVDYHYPHPAGEMGVTLCSIKTSEVIPFMWLFRSGRQFDILNVNEELSESEMLDRVKLEYGNTKRDVILKLAEFIL